MTRSQRIILISTAILLFGMLLYPPFSISLGESKFNLGYHFILSPPKWEGLPNEVGYVEAATLGLQFFVVVFCGGVLYLLSGKKKSNY